MGFFSSFKINFYFLQQRSFYRFFYKSKRLKESAYLKSTGAPVDNSLLYGPAFIFSKKEFLFLQRNV